MTATERLFEGFTFKVADDDERARALDLRRRIYADELGNPGDDERDQAAAHLVALDGHGTVVSALRVVGPQQRPFDLERFVCLDRVLSPASRPAEISRFCVAPNHRAVHRGQVVHLGMLKLLYEFARQQGITDLLALALPELQAVYTVAFFIQLDIIIEHPTWGPTHVMHFDMAHTERLHGSSKHPVARLLFQTNVPNVLL